VYAADALRQRHLIAWQQYLAERPGRGGAPLKPRSINKRLETARGFLSFLASQGYVQSTLADTLQYVRQPKLLPGSVLEHAQVRKLLSRIPTTDACGHRDRAMLELLYSSGIRVGELLGLDVHDIDPRNATMRVTGKADKERIVPIGRTALRYLDSYRLAVRPFLLRDRSEKALFLDAHGGRLAYHRVLRIVHRYARLAGLAVNVTPHTFRRSCTTELIRSGANMYHVKELLGHESLDTLKHYAKLTIADLKKTHAKHHPRERSLD